jgi:hypothetical protein
MRWELRGAGPDLCNSHGCEFKHEETADGEMDVAKEREARGCGGREDVVVESKEGFGV